MSEYEKRKTFQRLQLLVVKIVRVVFEKLFLLTSTLHFALHQVQVVHTSANETFKIFAEHGFPSFQESVCL